MDDRLAEFDALSRDTWLARLHNRLAAGKLLPWRLSHLGGFFNTSLAVPRRRRMLPGRIARETAGQPDDTTVVMAVRNRGDYRLTNALHSLRDQRYDRGRIHPLVVDYGSEPDQAREIRRRAETGGAAYLAVTGRAGWNKSHCLNLGFKIVTTKFLMSTDVDVLLAENYIATVVDELRARPLSVCYSQCLDLPESCTPALERAAAEGLPLDLDALRRQATPRSAGGCTPGVNASYALFYQWIRGYDECYFGWGSEDNDLTKRFRYLGLAITTVRETTYYLHQWHPKFTGSDDPDRAKAIARNERYFENNHSIVRNPAGWGELSFNAADGTNQRA